MLGDYTAERRKKPNVTQGISLDSFLEEDWNKPFEQNPPHERIFFIHNLTGV